MASSLIGSRYGVTEDEIRALESFVKMSRATEDLGAELQRSISETGLSPAQLYELSGVLEREPVGEREVEAAALATLEERGLLRRQRSDDDHRSVVVSTTDSGRRLIQSAYDAYTQRLTEMMSVLSGAEREDLGQLCERLSTGITAPR
ncbi:MAG: hypothetical protein DME04_23395 [Candidatus Rokuibacteriota bacterium]|nr:MAG: hypothetical protein DME04_23395 [Candidatus Rokubacteria bacterium]